MPLGAGGLCALQHHCWAKTSLHARCRRRGLGQEPHVVCGRAAPVQIHTYVKEEGSRRQGGIWISKSLKAGTAADEAEDTEVYLRLISIVFVAPPRGKTCFSGALLWGQRMQDEWKCTDSPPHPTPTRVPSQQLKKEMRIDGMTETRTGRA